MRENEIKLIYSSLYNHYGPQGWWPLLSRDISTKEVKMVNHPLNYDLPKTRNEIYEIILGTILTQNTAWNSAEIALRNLKDLDAINPQNLLDLDSETFKQAIRSAGFLNQKSVYINEVTKFYIGLDDKIPTRKELLEVKGVGNETADSILLYAFKQPEFVVDTYTKRIFSQIDLIDYNDNYNKIKTLFETQLPRDMIIYNEYHALIVAHAKKYYSRKPYGVDDTLLNP
ncbi:endonuclease III domain-containing protein [Methanobacterium sp.]|uniref:endonuclease III domain-containing protein n=1 Tax=Methanobacterium sp. TaxID=2164 RepID=UPI003C775235